MSSEEPPITGSEENVLKGKGYALTQVVGEGSYAKVYKTLYKVDETRQMTLACKVIDTTKAPRDYLTKFLPRELDVLIRVSHPHIIDVTCIFQRRAKYFVLLRYAENGDLLEFITLNGAIPENQARLWMRQMMSALVYLHALNIAHRDLKCENILVTVNYNVKLTDFGFARTLKQGDKDVLSETYCGSLSYAAPQVLKGIPYLPKPADMWSIGVILYTMLNKALPFNETSVKRLYDKQINRKWRFRTVVANELSMECRKQVTSLLEPDVTDRPTAAEVFSGDWMAMDPGLMKLTLIEETLLKKALANSDRDDKEESQSQRVAEIRKKARKADIFKVLKTTDTEGILNIKSKNVLEDND